MPFIAFAKNRSIIFKKGKIEAQGNYASLKSELASLSSSESNETADSLYEQEKSKSNQPENTESDKKLRVMSDEMKEKEKVGAPDAASWPGAFLLTSRLVSAVQKRARRSATEGIRQLQGLRLVLQGRSRSHRRLGCHVLLPGRRGHDRFRRLLAVSLVSRK